MSEAVYVKVAFELEQDENGYPPEEWETLWASEVEDGLCCLDNIPFFARGVSPGDVVRVRREGGSRIFEEVVRPSRNSVFQVYLTDEKDMPAARAAFVNLGFRGSVPTTSASNHLGIWPCGYGRPLGRRCQLD